MTKKKIGRNDPCPCGSGRKYKRCCLNNSQKSDKNISKSTFEKVTKHLEKERMRKQRFGEVRPIIHGDFKEHKFVAVGNALHFSPKWKTFHDFLFDYIKTCLGEEWGTKEIKKPFPERHPILQWYNALCLFEQKNKINGQEIHSADCTGPVMAYLSLAYDLYIARHHSLLQSRLITRIKNIDQFQGARYELYVIASFIRAGFDVYFEDESDVTRTHCEFSAIHKTSNKKYSVEAKSRHRHGFLGFKGKPQSSEEIKLQVKKLLIKSLKKISNFTRVIFIDINMPPQKGTVFEKDWFHPLGDQVLEVEKMIIDEKPAPPAYLFFTNHPYHYVGEEEPEPKKDFIFTAINIPEFKRGVLDPLQQIEIARNNESVIFKLWESLNTHTKIPDTFE